MKPTTTVLLSGVLAVLAACAAHPDPIVDMKGVNPDLLAQDWADCEIYSREIAVGVGAAKGAGVGGAVGAVAGAINGDVGRSTANGALIGATRSGPRCRQGQTTSIQALPARTRL